MNKNTYHTKNDQRGIVSILITMIMLIVITLIVVGFTQVANRNRQESLDRQLSSQAFYAAESGINKAVTVMKAQSASNLPIDTQADCDGPKYPTTQLQTDPDIRVTCLMVNPNPSNIETTVSTTYATTMIINGVKADGSPANLQELTFKWHPVSGQPLRTSSCESNTGEWDQNYGVNCTVGLLKVDPTQLKDNNNMDAAYFAANTKTLYIKPMSPAQPLPPAINSFSAGQRSYIIGANCPFPGDGTCSTTISLSGAAQTKRYYARLTMMYKDSSKVVIDGKLNGGGFTEDAYFNGIQVVIDSTGKARDVLRRVQTRYSLNIHKDTSIPVSALGTGGTVCKRFTVTGTDVIAAPIDPTCAE